MLNAVYNPDQCEPIEKPNVIKRYGRLVPVCNGIIMIHPKRAWWWLLEIFTIICVSVFFYENHGPFPKLTLAIIFLGSFTLFISLKTTLTDPGVIPKPSPSDAEENEKIAKQQQKNGSRCIVKKVPTLNSKGEIQETDFYYCFKCKNFRLAGTYHCSTCDCCIKGFDHHCPVFGGCVGAGNLISFHIMVYLTPIFWLFIIGSVIYLGVAYGKFGISFHLILSGLIVAITVPIAGSLYTCYKDSCFCGSRIRGRRRRTHSGHFVDYPRQLPLPTRLEHIAVPIQPVDATGLNNNIEGSTSNPANLKAVDCGIGDGNQDNYHCPGHDYDKLLLYNNGPRKL